MWLVRFTKHALKAICKFDGKDRKRISDKVYHLAGQEQPNHHPQVKRLVSLDNVYRLRVGNFRVIFELIDTRWQKHEGEESGGGLYLDVTDVDTRGDIYK